jgi:hypothetical protein
LKYGEQKCENEDVINHPLPLLSKEGYFFVASLLSAPLHLGRGRGQGLFLSEEGE